MMDSTPTTAPRSCQHHSVQNSQIQNLTEASLIRVGMKDDNCDWRFGAFVQRVDRYRDLSKNSTKEALALQAYTLHSSLLRVSTCCFNPYLPVHRHKEVTVENMKDTTIEMIPVRPPLRTTTKKSYRLAASKKLMFTQNTSSGVCWTCTTSQPKTVETNSTTIGWRQHSSCGFCRMKRNLAMKVIGTSEKSANDEVTRSSSNTM